MNYLVIKDGAITQICTSPENLLEYLGVNVTDNGIIEVDSIGKQLPTSYNMKEFTKEEVIKDIIRYQLKKIEGLLKIGIYKLERI